MLVKEISNLCVMTKYTIPVHYVGDDKINLNRIMCDVFYVPNFKFNLLLVSSLASYTNIVVSFTDYGFLIQELL